MERRNIIEGNFEGNNKEKGFYEELNLQTEKKEEQRMLGIIETLREIGFEEER